MSLYPFWRCLEKVGDLVRIKYNGVVALIVEVEVWQAGADYSEAWFHLLNQPVSFRADRLEIISS